MFRDARWLVLPKEEYIRAGITPMDTTDRFACFRLAFTLPEEEGLTLNADLSASSRYRLWVNGSPVLSGPCKGDEHRQYFETIDLSCYLMPGDNVLAAQVLYNDPNQAFTQGDERAAIFGVRGVTAGHRLVMEGAVRDASGREICDITTGRVPWKVHLEGGFFLKEIPGVNDNIGAVSENFAVSDICRGWKENTFACNWPDAVIAEEAVPSGLIYTGAGVLPRYRLLLRPIPLLYERRGTFPEEMTGTWVLANGPLRVEAHANKTLILNAGVHMNAYPVWKFEGGTDAKVRILYSERFENDDRKIAESDMEHGVLKGLPDEIVLGGGSFTWEPFWVRTFRYIQIDIETADEMLVMDVPEFRRTGYPLEEKYTPDLQEEWQKKVWEICVRTLGNCMLETYMDCPFYEQMQFPMDTRLQALFTYAVSGDTRLARKTLEDYHCGMLPDGLIPGKYPSSYCQVISTFSLHYIFLLREYGSFTGDWKTVKRYRTDVDMVLAYYDRHIGEDGLVGPLGFWEFVDWQKEWNVSFGMPEARLHGPSTIINLQYAYALEEGAKIMEKTGRSAIAGEYRVRKAAVLHRIIELCWDSEAGLLREGPEVRAFSQHAQSWAVLAGLFGPDDARDVMKRTAKREVPGNGAPMTRVSFSTSFEYMRALLKTGLIDAMNGELYRWNRLVERDYTTCPEEPENGRSECHGWSALPIWFFTAEYGDPKTCRKIFPEDMGEERREPPSVRRI